MPVPERDQDNEEKISWQIYIQQPLAQPHLVQTPKH